MRQPGGAGAPEWANGVLIRGKVLGFGPGQAVPWDRPLPCPAWLPAPAASRPDPIRPENSEWSRLPAVGPSLRGSLNAGEQRQRRVTWRV